MNRLFRARRAFLLCALVLGGAPAAFCAVAAARRPLEPALAGPVVGQMVAELLERAHYDHRPIDDAISRKFLRGYIESYDYGHMFFDKPDVDELEARYGGTLGARLKAGDVGPAYAIFERFMARLTERRQLIGELLASSFTFTADESIQLDRTKAPWPSTPAEARELWRLYVKYEILQARLAEQKPEEQVKTVASHYDNLLESYREFDANDVLHYYLASLCRIYDPHSDYMPAPAEENFNISMRLALVGIGAQLRSEGGWTRIVSLIPGGPADVDKRLKPNDKIEAVAQGDDGQFLDVVGMKIDRLVGLIRGEKGTVVRLRVVPADAIDPATRVVIRLVRDEIHLRDQEAKAKRIVVHPAGGAALRVGVIDLPSFYSDMKSNGAGRSTTRDVGELLGGLMLGGHKREDVGIDGLVLDLRRNGGGALSEATALTGLFIKQGPVVQVKDAGGRVSVLDHKNPQPLYDGPLVVLTSRASASASEILAAALQDYGRAVVVGHKSTFGKGTVQSVIGLDQGLPPALRSYKAGAVHLTVQKFYRVSGGSTQNRGVIPDISLPSIEDHMDMTESSLPEALPYDEIPPASYERTDSVSPKLPALRAASAARVAVSPEFGYVREDVERYKKQLADKRVSLNEKKRREEKSADEERDRLRKKERLARGVPKREERDITLEALDGVLPAAPVKSTGTVPADYEKAPPAPDLMLEESIKLLGDMVGLPAEAVPARSTALTP